MTKKNDQKLKAELNKVVAADQLEAVTRSDLINNSMDQQSLPLLESGRDVDAFGDAEEVGLDDGSPRGRGRPKGAKNKKTEQWTDYLLANYRSPLIMFAETYSRPTAALSLELQCTLEEAFKIQMDAAKQLAPYVHQKLPQAIEIESEKGLVNLTFVVSDAYDAVKNNRALEIEGEEVAKVIDHKPQEKIELNQ